MISEEFWKIALQLFFRKKIRNYLVPKLQLWDTYWSIGEKQSCFGLKASENYFLK